MIEYKQIEQFSAYIFDFDGVLYQTQQANQLAYYQAFTQAGVTVDKSIFNKLNGQCWHRFLSESGLQLTEKQENDIRKKKTSMYPMFFGKIKRNNELFNLILKLRSKNKKTAIATSATSININNVLNHFNDTDLFDYILTRDDVKNSKPHPEIYSSCLTKLSLQASQCIVFEDSDIGQEAAEKAGLTTLRVDKL